MNHKVAAKKKKKKQKYSFFSESERSQYDVQTLYKCGDDLRQDILTLQLVSVMDAFWLDTALALRMKPYRVIQTGFPCGFVELVLASVPPTDIHTKHGTIRGNFNDKAHHIFLQSNSTASTAAAVQQNYARSLAGYSVATWVMGMYLPAAVLDEI